MNILVVDDEIEIADLIELYLTTNGYHVYKAYNGKDALKILEKRQISLAILDVMMPDIDGFTLCETIRKQYNFPIIMVTAKVQKMDKITGLTKGADDYITKPFEPLELVARVKSALRRYLYLGNLASAQEEKANVIDNGSLSLNLDEKQIYVDGEPVKLTATEYRIIELLMRNRGRVFSAEEIYERVWKEPAFATENTVMVHIRRIREKIEINPKVPKYLKVVWGIGYKMEKY